MWWWCREPPVPRATNLFDEALGAHRTVGGVSVWSTGVAG